MGETQANGEGLLVSFAGFSGFTFYIYLCIRYIIIPVEVATSIFWYGSIFFSLQAGLDIAALLESLGASEATLAKLPSSEAGYHALTFICYKVYITYLT